MMDRDMKMDRNLWLLRSTGKNDQKRKILAWPMPTKTPANASSFNQTRRTA